MRAKNIFRLSAGAVISFFVSMALCFGLIIITIINSVSINRLHMEQFITEHYHHINQRINKLFHKLDSLDALVIQSDGNIDNFDRIAMYITDDDAILNIIVAPGGIVSQVYPLYGNETLVGHDFLAGINEAATAARDTGVLVLGRIQNEQTLRGVKPVYINGEFWGIVSLTLSFPKVVQEVAELDFVAYHEFNYEWRTINPDTGEPQVIAGEIPGGVRFLEKRFELFDFEWRLKVAPYRAWYDYTENLILVVSGTAISFLVLLIMQNNFELKRMKQIFENMAKTDALTGIHNRRYFLETAEINLERGKRLGTHCYVILFDLDRFKGVNDTHGHEVGDYVLTETAARIKKLIRPYDLFARYGGEEFIIFAADINAGNAAEMAERLRRCICDEKFSHKDIFISLSASFGVALVGDGQDLKEAIKYADQALYRAKNEGRNRVVIHKS